MRRSYLASLATLVLIGCSGAAEQPILNQLFTASRLRDNTTLNGFSMVALDPRTQGSVLSFSITSVSPESGTPLGLKSLAKVHDDAKAEDAAFNKRRADYAQQNGEAVSRVVKAGREAKLKGNDAEVQAAWFKMIDEGRDIARKITDAKRKLASESAVVDMSVADPRNPVDATKLDGELVSKNVTVDANVRLPNGQTTPKTYVVTMQRAVLKGPKGDITGRWIVTGLKDTAAPAGTKTS
jgi:hypothetical protein